VWLQLFLTSALGDSGRLLALAALSHSIYSANTPYVIPSRCVFVIIELLYCIILYYVIFLLYYVMLYYLLHGAESFLSS